MPENEIEELQSRIAFQEDALASLNDIVSKQDAEIHNLQQQLKVLYKKIDELKHGLEHNGGHARADIEKPPHY